MKHFLNQLSIKKKIIYYSYLVITPIMLIISGLLFANNLQEDKKSQIDANIKVVGSLADSVDMLQAEVIDLSTYICINNEVNKILTADNAEILNRDARLWLNDAPMQMIQDMIALKGYIKTIAIYPENGVQPYLRCIDSSSYIQEMREIRKQEIYRKAIERKGKVIWQKVSKESKDTYQANRNDKIVLYRELFDSTKRKQLGYIVIGMSSDKITDLCVNAVQHDTEGILIVSFDGSELTRYGEVDEEVVRFIQSDEFVQTNYKQREQVYYYNNYTIFCKQNSKNSAIILKIIPKQN